MQLLIKNYLFKEKKMARKKKVVETGIKAWVKSRITERTSWDGAGLIVLGALVLFMAPLAKIAAGVAILYGAWTIWKAE